MCVLTAVVTIHVVRCYHAITITVITKIDVMLCVYFPVNAAPTEVQVGGGSTLFHCDGQCGDPICEALFKTDRALKQHINQPRHPQVLD